VHRQIASASCWLQTEGVIGLILGSGERWSNQAARELFIGGLPAGIRQVQAVARVVLRGLQPLRDAVRNSEPV